jgi:hypothetical protein
MPTRLQLTLVAAILSGAPLTIAAAQTTAVNGTRPGRLIIRNAIVVDGNGTPAKGPFDIVLEGGTITQIVALDPVAVGRNAAGRRARADANTVEIDATGKYVLPGLINAHAHLQDERGGTAQPIDYELKVWLACGITTVRDVGSDTRKALAWRDASAKGTLAAPRIFIYPQFGRPTNADSARARVRSLKAMGVDGIKLLGVDRDIMQAMEDEAHKEGLRIAHHVGVEETNAWDDIRFGTTSIEHWYGIPDAANPEGVQGFPAAVQLQQRDRSLSLGRAPLARGRSRRDSRWSSTPWSRARSHGCRRSTSMRHRGTYKGPRPSRGSATISIRRSRSISGRIQPTMARISSAGRRPTRRTGRRITEFG